MKRIFLVLAVTVIAITLTRAKTITVDPQGSAAAAVVQAPDNRASLIDAYFSARKMPLAGYGEKMVIAADTNGLDWRLLPAISVRESSGGLQACGDNPFGWNSCKSTFPSMDDAIATVAANLGGNVTGTKAYYVGKTTVEILDTYNPPAIVASYTQQVVDIMDHIGSSTLLH